MATAVQSLPTPAVHAPPTPLQDAAATIGDLLRETQSAAGDAATVAALKESLGLVIEGARELGAAYREIARIRRYAEKVELANSYLMQRISTAHAEREQLVRDLVPALDIVTDVFTRAREQRDALAPSSTPYVPKRSEPAADSLDGYREAPVEAHHGE